ncbi:uncharacterized protein LOC127872490 [Dreissena polymorpha]|nr:uncharacterized protein LOC127870956 [Dreissena polymorpha]XP_052271779.1 uncharacterized protein LOC127872490 [Dreissena polymorpha]
MDYVGILIIIVTLFAGGKCGINNGLHPRVSAGNLLQTEKISTFLRTCRATERDVGPCPCVSGLAVCRVTKCCRTRFDILQVPERITFPPIRFDPRPDPDPFERIREIGRQLPGVGR